MTDNINGHLLLLMAPSGSGKGKIVESLGDVRDKIYFAKTFTSRERRSGAEENPLYNFVSKEEFEQMIEEGAFIEWANFGGNLYGTPKSEVTGPLAEGKVVFKEMELQGIMQMKEIVGDEHMTVIYIEAGGWDALKQRITNRAQISDAELELRRQRYEEESRAKHMADIIISNKDGELDNAREEFKHVVLEIIKNVGN